MCCCGCGCGTFSNTHISYDVTITSILWCQIIYSCCICIHVIVYIVSAGIALTVPDTLAEPIIIDEIADVPAITPVVYNLYVADCDIIDIICALPLCDHLIHIACCCIIIICCSNIVI